MCALVISTESLAGSPPRASLPAAAVDTTPIQFYSGPNNCSVPVMRAMRTNPVPATPPQIRGLPDLSLEQPKSPLLFRTDHCMTQSTEGGRSVRSFPVLRRYGLPSVLQACANWHLIRARFNRALLPITFKHAPVTVVQSLHAVGASCERFRKSNSNRSCCLHQCERPLMKQRV
jgi:hypothetical protein